MGPQGPKRHEHKSKEVFRVYKPCPGEDSSGTDAWKTLYTFEVKMKAKKWQAEKLKMVKKTVFPRIVRGPWGCNLLSSLLPKSRFRGSEKSFPRCEIAFKMIQNKTQNIYACIGST